MSSAIDVNQLTSDMQYVDYVNKKYLLTENWRRDACVDFGPNWISKVVLTGNDADEATKCGWNDAERCWNCVWCPQNIGRLTCSFSSANMRVANLKTTAVLKPELIGPSFNEISAKYFPTQQSKDTYFVNNICGNGIPVETLPRPFSEPSPNEYSAMMNITRTIDLTVYQPLAEKMFSGGLMIRYNADYDVKYTTYYYATPICGTQIQLDIEYPGGITALFASYNAEDKTIANTAWNILVDEFNRRYYDMINNYRLNLRASQSSLLVGYCRANPGKPGCRDVCKSSCGAQFYMDNYIKDELGHSDPTIRDAARAWCQANSDVCAPYVTTFCASNQNDEFCACLNAKAQQDAADFNKKARDSASPGEQIYDVPLKCINSACNNTKAFKTTAMMVESCPNICQSIVNITNSGYMVGNDFVSAQNCGAALAENANKIKAAADAKAAADKAEADRKAAALALQQASDSQKAAEAAAQLSAAQKAEADAKANLAAANSSLINNLPPDAKRVALPDQSPSDTPQTTKLVIPGNQAPAESAASTATSKSRADYIALIPDNLKYPECRDTVIKKIDLYLSTNSSDHEIVTMIDSVLSSCTKALDESAAAKAQREAEQQQASKAQAPKAPSTPPSQKPPASQPQTQTSPIVMILIIVIVAAVLFRIIAIVRARSKNNASNNR